MNFEVTSHVDDVIDGLHEAMSIALEEIGLRAERHAKEICPVDTGRLRNSISHAVESSDTAVIGTNVEYAPYIELGHSQKAPDGFLGPAVKNFIPEYKQIAEKYMKS